MLTQTSVTRTRLLLAGAALLLSFPLSAQVEWLRTYNDYSFGSRERLHAMALNAAGEVYLCGTAEEMGNDKSFVLVKYDRDLQELWKVEAQGAALSEPEQYLRLAVDPVRDEAFVAGAYLRQEEGYFSYESILQKYDGSGRLQWRVMLPAKHAYPTGLTGGADGSVYVSLVRQGEFGDTEIHLLRYGGDGGLRWHRTYNTFAGETGYVARKILVDDAAEAGYLAAAHFNRVHLLQFSLADGQTQWERQPAFYSEEQIFFGGLVRRADGAVCLGYSAAENIKPGDYDLRLLCIAADGSPVWERSYDAGDQQPDVLDVLAADSLGLYLGAHTRNPGRGNDIWLLRLDGDGPVDWQRRHDGHGYDDVPRDLAVDSGGIVYCSAFRATGSGRHDALLLAYGRDGTLHWQQVDAAVPGEEYDFQRLALADDGRLLVRAGFTQIFDRPEMAFYPFKADLTVRSYEVQGGSELARAGYSGRGIGQFESRWVKVAPSGNIYQSGWRNLGFSVLNSGFHREIYDLVLLKYTPGGELLWSRVFEGDKHNEQWPPFRFEFDSQEASLLLLQETYEANRTRLVKYDAEGGLQWDRYLSDAQNESFPLMLKVSPTDDAFVLYAVDGKLRMTKISSEGVPLWTRDLEDNHTACYGDYTYSLEVTAAGDLLLLYSTDGCTFTRVLALLDAEGKSKWNTYAAGWQRPLIWDNQYVYTFEFPYLSRYRLTDGALEWEREIAVDPVGLFGIVRRRDRLVLVGAGKIVVLSPEGEVLAAEAYRQESVWALFEEDHVILIDNLFNNQVYDYDANYRGSVSCEDCYHYEFYPPYERYLGGSIVTGAVSADAYDGALYLGGQAFYGPRGRALFAGGGSEMILIKTRYQLAPVTHRPSVADAGTGLDVFPNPSRGAVTVRLANPPVTAIARLSDFSGKVLWERPLVGLQTEHELTLGVSPGVFLLQVVTERAAFSQKVAVAR